MLACEVLLQSKVYSGEQGVSQATKTGLVTCAMLIQYYFSLGCKIYNFKCKKVTMSLITIIR